MLTTPTSFLLLSPKLKIETIGELNVGFALMTKIIPLRWST